jgi:tRNA(Arg) A34 adenosine deaminase TadA
MSVEPGDLMRIAIARAREGVAAGQTPFGCAVSLGGKILAAEHNRVLASTDITAHAEISALREACRSSGRIDLSGAIAASTCEPCAMCMAALHWARVETVYFGATIADAAAAGFNELTLPAAEVLRLGGSAVHLAEGVLVEECRALIREWAGTPGHRAY